MRCTTVGVVVRKRPSTTSRRQPRRKRRTTWTPATALLLFITLLPGTLVALPYGPPPEGEEEPPARSQGPWTISGSLVDEDGKSIAKAAIKLRPMPSAYDAGRQFLTGQRQEPVAQATSARDGVFSISVPRDGLWSLEVSKRGFIAVEVPSWFPIFRNIHYAPIQLRSLTNNTTTVTVIDQAGKPINNAKAQIQPLLSVADELPGSQRTSRAKPAPHLARTLEDGIATFRAKTHEFVLVVTASGYLPLRMTIGRRDYQRGSKIQRVPMVMLEPASSLQLRFELSPGVPARHALVFVNDIPVAMADERGQVTVPVAQHRPQTLEILHPSLASLEITLPNLPPNPLPNSQPNKTLQLEPPIRFTGTVQLAMDGSAIEEAWVWSDSSHPTRTTDSGEYSVLASQTPFAEPYQSPSSAFNDRRSIGAAAPNHFATQLSLDSDHLPGSPVDSLLLHRTSTLRGRVTDEWNRTLEGVHLRGPDPHPSWWSQNPIQRLSVAEPSAVSNKDGTFTLWPISPLEEGLVIGHIAGYGKATVDTPAIDPGKSAKVELRMIRGLLVTGRIVDESDLPIRGAEVVLTEDTQGGTKLSWEAFMAQYQTAGIPKRAITNQEGEFELVDVTAGHHSLRASARTYAPARVSKLEVLGPAPPSLPASSESSASLSSAAPSSGSSTEHLTNAETTIEPPPPFDLGTVVLSPGAVIEGRVATSSGKAITGASVTLQVNGQRLTISFDEQEPSVTTTNEFGRFRFDSLAHRQNYAIHVE